MFEMSRSCSVVHSSAQAKIMPVAHGGRSCSWALYRYMCVHDAHAHMHTHTHTHTHIDRTGGRTYRSITVERRVLLKEEDKNRFFVLLKEEDKNRFFCSVERRRQK